MDLAASAPTTMITTLNAFHCRQLRHLASAAQPGLKLRHRPHILQPSLRARLPQLFSHHVHRQHRPYIQRHSPSQKVTANRLRQVHPAARPSMMLRPRPARTLRLFPTVRSQRPQRQRARHPCRLSTRRLSPSRRVVAPQSVLSRAHLQLPQLPSRLIAIHIPTVTIRDTPPLQPPSLCPQHPLDAYFLVQ